MAAPRRVAALAAQLAARPQQPVTAATKSSTAASIAARAYSTAAPAATAESEVRHRKMQSVRMFLLNRPRALNALTLSMINSIAPQLRVWEASSLCHAIVMASTSERAFCAGGDVVSVVKAMESKDPLALDNARDFFRNEYRLNYEIGTLSKAFIAIWDGIVMGGGVGLSIHAPFRIGMETTHFAMPETDIGFFPDVGGSFFLPRLDGELGTYLALTGDSLRGEENFLAGTATHFVPKDRIAALIEQLKEVDVGELDVVAQVIEDFSVTPSLDKFRSWRLGGKVSVAIDRIFAHDTLEEIVTALKAGISDPIPEVSQFCAKTLDKMKTKSPLSMKVALKQLRLGRMSEFAACFQREFQMAQRFMTKSDFAVGVRSKLIEKSKSIAPWSVPFDRMSEITEADVDYYFPPVKPSANSKEYLQLPGSVTFWDYPSRPLSGLPTRQDIQRVVAGRAQRLRTMSKMRSIEEAIGWLESNWGSLDYSVLFIQGTSRNIFPISIQGGFGRSKIGLKEKTRATLEEFTKPGEDGYLEWVV